ncbi:hypothetical protein VTL71DRAFT_9913 [Oculimacula yallundae]|uniref:NACHT domain-containing protein n=1 Tax=Oculimacula yallundae TaxID=86028 RepID=A0ABR4BSL4_9HELO
MILLRRKNNQSNNRSHAYLKTRQRRFLFRNRLFLYDRRQTPALSDTMLDPLTALGVASNVLALIDFSAKIISGAVSIYGSADGASKDHADVEAVAMDLSQMSGKLSDDIRALALNTGASLTAQSPSSPVSVHQEALCKLALRCRKLADDLIQSLQKLKVKSDKHKLFHSGRASIKILLKAEDIARYKRTLDDLRSEMTARMVSLISEHQREMFEILRRQSEDRYRSDRMIKLSTDNLENGMASAMEKLSLAPSKGDFTELMAVINELAGEWKQTTSLLKIINSLSFESISARWVAVEPAYATTFEWAFHDSTSTNVKIPNLGEWLRSRNEIFWVTGKPGSGKSTFMKYVCMEKRTEQILQAWAGHHQLIIAKHFFWSAGTAIQRSLAGLLQSLLSDLLGKCPKLSEIAISTDRLGAPVQSMAPWTITELKECFSRIQTQTQLDLRICLFVDGLDEYEGDHEEVLEIFEDLAKNPGIKLCLASRDWNIFRDWFKDRPMIRLEDLTKVDIRNFTQSKLDQDRRFAILRQGNSTYDDVIDLIVSEAEGVFLWVYLVVQSLKRGFIEGDTVKDLTRRIKALPKKLDDFFLDMLNSVEEVYHVQSAEILQVCQAHPDAQLPLMSASFFDQEDFLFGTSLQASQRLKMDEIESCCKITERRVRARCRDLVVFVKVGWPEEWYIEFVHRSAKDFIQSDYVQKMLASRVRKHFSAPRYLCQVTIAEAKLCPQKHGAMYSFDRIAEYVFECADLYERSCGNNALQSMDWLDELSFTLEADGSFQPEDYGRTEPMQGFSVTWLFSQALTFGFRLYLRHCIVPFSDTDTWNLTLGPRLIAECSRGYIRGTYTYNTSCLQMGFFLFSLGAIRGETPVVMGHPFFPYHGQPLCFCILGRLATRIRRKKGNEPLFQSARQLIDEVLRRTDIQKLGSSSLLEMQQACRTWKAHNVSTTGIDSFLRDADLMLAAEEGTSKRKRDREDEWMDGNVDERGTSKRKPGSEDD